MTVKTKYNLEGLMTWVIAMGVNTGITAVVALIVLSETLLYFNGVASTNMAGGASLLAEIIILVGIRMLRSYSPYFAKAYKHTIIGWIITLVGVYFGVAAILELSSKATTYTIVAISLILIGITICMFAIREQFMGMRDIALANQNDELAQRFSKLLIPYLILCTTSLLIVIIIFIYSRNFFISDLYSDPEGDFFFGSGEIVLLISVVITFCQVAVQIRWLLAAMELYKQYDGENLPFIKKADPVPGPPKLPAKPYNFIGEPWLAQEFEEKKSLEADIKKQ